MCLSRTVADELNLRTYSTLQCSEEIGRTYPRFAAQEACAGPDLPEMLDGPRLFSRTLRSVTQRFALFSPALQRGTQFL